MNALPCCETLLSNESMKDSFLPENKKKIHIILSTLLEFYYKKN